MPNEEVDLVSTPVVFSSCFDITFEHFGMLFDRALESASFFPDPLRPERWVHAEFSIKIRMDKNTLNRSRVLIIFETESQTVAVGVDKKQEYAGPKLAEMQNRIQTWIKTWVTALSK